VSDTPRTDEFIGEYSEWSPAPQKNWPAFARQLERELTTAQERIKRLMEAGDRMDLYASPHDSDKWNEAKECK
jgi:hypothetical protein